MLDKVEMFFDSLTKILARDIYHKVYYDNLISSVPLLVALENMGMRTLGTGRPNRLPGCSFTSDSEMKKQGRGTLRELLPMVSL
jgi:hypothetical protein